jgi:hypothetical protein
MIVTNLNPDGPGSLQEACAAQGPRIVVFEVSGVVSNTITIENSNITIAGQTAPGAGIAIAGMLGSKEGIRDVVIRHIRVRPKRAADTFAGPEGEKTARRVHECGLANPYLKEEQKVFSIAPFRAEPNESHHTAFLNGISNLVLDHVSCAWGADEVVSLCRTPNVTVQWCSIEEGAIKEGRKYSGIHNFALFSAYLDKTRISVHHNLIAHNSRRNPTIPAGPADVRNNVLYNYRHGFTHEGEQSGDFNYVGNWLKTDANSRGVLEGVSWGKAPATWAWFDAAARYFLEDNLVDGQPAPIPETVGKAKTPFPRLREPLVAPAVTTHSASEAYELVLARAGAFPRDAVTQRTVEEARSGTGQWGRLEPKGGLMEGLTPGTAPQDTDRDGMPDEWEKKKRLDPAQDDSAKVMPSGYTAVEVYLAERAEALVKGSAKGE